MNMPVRRGRWPERWRGNWPWESWDPFGEFAQLWDRMGSLFEQGAQPGPQGWMPVAETEETDDAYVVRAELPGMRRDDIQVELRGNELCISGEVNQEKRDNTLRRRTGTFSYRTSLPSDADAEKVDARLAEGVLTVRVPKSARTRARRIEISG